MNMVKYLFAIMLLTMVGCSKSPEEQNSPPQSATDYGAFHGQWMQTGEVIFEIIHKKGKPIQIKSPPNDTWTTEFKNIKLEGTVLSFDSYNYTPPDPKLKTIINPTGSHPFSGVKCENVLTLDEKDPELSHYVLTTEHGSFEGKLRKRPVGN